MISEAKILCEKIKKKIIVTTPDLGYNIYYKSGEFLEVIFYLYCFVKGEKIRNLFKRFYSLQELENYYNRLENEKKV